MKILSTFLIVFIVLESCGVKNDSEQRIAESPLVHLECLSLGEDEYFVPRSEVYLVVGERRIKVGMSQSCDSIERNYYSSYEIPDNAISACGGWYAGSGDYYYVIFEDGMIEVYGMVLDEGNGGEVEGEDLEEVDPFQWQLIHSEIYE